MTAQSPFQRLLSPQQFEDLPVPVRRLHSLEAPAFTCGTAEITASSNPLAWLISKFAGLPQPGRDVPTTVDFIPDGRGGEHWKRRFGARRYASVMVAGEGADQGFLIERFGLFRLLFRLELRPEGLAWSLERWRFLGLPLPRWTAPAIKCLEYADGERFAFDIDVAFPIAGRVTHYRGWLSAQGERVP